MRVIAGSQGAQEAFQSALLVQIILKPLCQCRNKVSEDGFRLIPIQSKLLGQCADRFAAVGALQYIEQIHARKNIMEK